MKLSNLANVLRAAGLTVVECDGWANRGYAGQDLADVRGVLWHHTATHRSRFDNSDAPTLSMCLNGRSDLAGPLCNIVFGRNGTVYLVAAGVANHAGAGSAAGIPTNMGNHYLIGIEMESSGIAPWDWTPDQLRVAPYLGAALERSYGTSLQIAHYEYSSQGKIDPAGWPGGMDGLRESINASLSGASITPQSTTITPEEDEDMPLSDDDLRKVYDAVWFGAPGARLIPNEANGGGEWPYTTLGSLTARISRDVVRPQLADLKGSVGGQYQLSAAEVADAVIEAVGADLAAQVVTALGQKLGDK